MFSTFLRLRGGFRLRLPLPGKAALALFCAVVCLLGLSAVPAAAAGAAPSAVPPDQAARSAVALAFDRAGLGFAFYRGADAAVYMRTFRGSTWSAQRRIGGVILGDPAAAVAGTTVVLAARGTNNALWVRMMNHGRWGRWISWGGALSSSPAIIGGSTGRVDAFVRGRNDALWTRTLRPGHRLTAWKSLGGRLSTAPAAVAFADNLFEVAAAGPGHVVWTASTDSRWIWQRVGGRRTYSAPAIGYIPQSNGAFILIRGTDHALWADGFGGGRSTGWRKLGGQMIGAPTAAGTRQPVPHMIAAIRGSDRAVWTTRYPTSRAWWSGLTRAWIPSG